MKTKSRRLNEQIPPVSEAALQRLITESPNIFKYYDPKSGTAYDIPTAELHKGLSHAYDTHPQDYSQFLTNAGNTNLFPTAKDIADAIVKFYILYYQETESKK